MRRLLLIAGVALLALAGTAQAAPTPDAAPGATGPATIIPGRYVCAVHLTFGYRDGASQTCRYVPLGHASAKRVVHCKAGYHRKTVWARRHHKRVRQTRCVRVKPKATAPTTAPIATLAAPIAVRAGIDPSYTQDPADNLKVTWTYSASSTDVPLPAGTLSLTVQEPNKAGSSGGCTMNVGDTVTGGTCTQELPHYGSWNVTVSYTGASTTIAPASSTETEDIEPLPVPPPPPPAPITVAKAWGTDAPSSAPTIAANVIGQTANITLTDDNFEGAAGLTITDNLGDGCTAAIVGTQATCAMPVTATPSAFTVGYPGGTSTTVTVGQQATTTTWPADSVRVSNPSVTVQRATVLECGGFQVGGPLWEPPGSNVGCGPNPGNGMASGQWPNPVVIGTATRVEFSAEALGSLPSDQAPAGYLTYTLTGPAAPSFEYDEDWGAPSASQDCSVVTNDPGQAVGGCMYTFGQPGAYTLTVAFHSLDPNYAGSALGYSETISVT